jgi:hypothetical protein
MSPRLLTTLLAPFALAACGQADSAPVAPARPAQPIAGASATHPVVLELFQSQGCSDCPPANANVNALADRPDILALSFAVTYWDQLGWKDTFGSPRWTARQWEYARAGGRAEVATPQVIVNGGPTIVGSNRAQLDAMLAKQGPARGGPEISDDKDRVHLAAAAAPAAPVTVWLVRYDPRSREVPIRAGENGGRTLPHRDIVRELVRLGDWNGPAADFRLPSANEAGLSSAVLMQQGQGGAIIAARKLAA